MSLGSVLQTALSGISAAELVVGVVANNLANSQTPGFKASRPQMVSQSPRTLSSGAAPSGRTGGSNPAQVGSGVRLGTVSMDFSQGSIVPDRQPLSLALQGEGLFVLQGPDGQQLYTRDGNFSLNAERELVSVGGDRVLGFGVDEDFQIDDTGLVPLEIPLGRQVASQDDSSATLTGFSIGEDGRIRGQFSDGVWRDLGQIQLARPANPSGLEQRGGNLFAASPSSGVPVISSPQEDGAAKIVAGARELSNTDIGQNLVDLSLGSIQFKASVHVLDTTGRLLDELTSLRRME